MNEEFIADTDLDDYEYLQDHIYHCPSPADVPTREYLKDLYKELSEYDD